MFNVQLQPGPRIDVAYRKHLVSYAIDGSLPNPLEAFYASLAGCAGVFAKKACRAHGVSDAGIEIQVKPIVTASNPLMPERIVTVVRFPADFSPPVQAAVLEEIRHCAVKEVVRAGSNIEFQVVSE